MKNKGITLISLVITIVVLIILSSVGIYLSLGNNGIFTRAKQAKELTNKQTATEIINLKITNCQMNKYAEKQETPTLKELSISLRDDSEIQYVTEKSQIASTKYEVGDSPSSIYTKLNDYPYEFEINSQLQLASIDGIKVTDNNNNNSSNIGLKLIEQKSTTGVDGTATFSVEKGKKYYVEILFICSNSANCGIADPVLNINNSKLFVRMDTLQQAGYGSVYMGRDNATFVATDTNVDVYVRGNVLVAAAFNYIITLYTLS